MFMSGFASFISKKNLKKLALAMGLFLGAPAAGVYVVGIFSPEDARFPNQVRHLKEAYDQWAAAHERNGGDKNIRLNVSWVKGLSTEFSKARGHVVLNLIEGTATAEFQGIPKTGIDLWLVNSKTGPNRSVIPEEGDRFIHLGRIEPAGKAARLSARIEPEQLRGFELDMVMGTSAGQEPGKGGLLFGAPSLFQRLYTRNRTGETKVALQSTMSRLLSLAGSGTAEAAVNQDLLEPLVKSGLNLFFNEKFSGNGRTCGTCHRAENNLTIDPRFIATLPANDALFVAEFTPALSQNFEKPELMRKLGLILENPDGFGDLENRFVMRGTPHTLAMRTSLTPAPPGVDGTTIPPSQRTGWSGDGAPGNGTLREFAIGAVTQHFTKRLNRQAGVDFRLPTNAELDAMEAFQLATGRQAELDLASLQLKGKIAARGLAIFQATDTSSGTVAAGKCSVCHANAGANLAGLNVNFNFDTGVEQMADKPANTIAGMLPTDGGFGTSPHPTIAGAFGNGTFNTPVIVEAADSGPFFHNNAVSTIEEAVGFYNSNAFKNSPSGQFLAATDTGGVAIRLEATQVEAVAAFLRVINALENIRAAVEYGDTTIVARTDSTTSTFLKFMSGDTKDAIEVLESAGLHPEAVAKLKTADKSVTLALSTNTCFFMFCSTITRDNHIRTAITNLNSAQTDLKM